VISPSHNRRIRHRQFAAAQQKTKRRPRKTQNIAKPHYPWSIQKSAASPSLAESDPTHTHRIVLLRRSPGCRSNALTSNQKATVMLGPGVQLAALHENGSESKRGNAVLFAAPRYVGDSKISCRVIDASRLCGGPTMQRFGLRNTNGSGSRFFARP